MTDPAEAPKSFMMQRAPEIVDQMERTGTIAVSNVPLRGLICIHGSTGPLVTIHTEDDGRLEYGPGYEPDEAARLFWQAFQRNAMMNDFGPGLTRRIDEELAAGQRAEEQVRLLTEGAIQRTAILEECRDILEQAGYNGAHGDDWPRIAPAVRAMAADLKRARQQVKRLDGMAAAWLERLPDTIVTATAVDAIHQVTRPQAGSST